MGLQKQYLLFTKCECHTFYRELMSTDGNSDVMYLELIEREKRKQIDEKQRGSCLWNEGDLRLANKLEEYFIVLLSNQ